MNSFNEGNRSFLSQLFQLALPIVAQNFLQSTLNYVDILMIGQLDETAIAAVGVANQLCFLFIVTQFGIHSGISIYTAQYWGRRDIQSIRALMGISFQVGLGFSAIFAFAALVFPSQIIALFSQDPAVINQSIVYLRIVALSFPLTAVTFGFTSSLRSTELVVPPLAAAAAAVASNILLNYLLIFGKLGLPVLGVKGAALGTCIARCFECMLILLITYSYNFPSAAPWSFLLRVERNFFRRVMQTSWPVILHEFSWVLGFSIYNLIYSRLGTLAFAAVNICASIERLAMIFLIGISMASAIMIGNCIGADREDEAHRYAVKLLRIQVSLAMGLGLLIIAVRPLILAFYHITDATYANAYYLLLVIGLILWGKAINIGLIIGTFRSGGDTRFGLFLDFGGVWLVGIPMGIIGAFVLHLPVYWVMAMVVTEEVFKLFLGIWRLFSRKWIRDLTGRGTTQISPVEI